ncbi:MAG TPA: GHMP kinase [Actinomycetota bacterium]|nr:GHMP kinase [Actinomycetota bacterium]
MPSDLAPVHAVAPLRISFVGGGTDFPHWYRDHGGAVLSTTIDHVVRVTATPRNDRAVRVRSLDLGQLVQYQLDEGPEYDGVMDLAKAAIDRMGLDTGLDVDIESEAPPGSGLGGSSALVTAVVAALACLAEISLSCEDVARLSYAIERDDLGISGGWQDQYAAAFGGFNLIEFDREGARVTPVDVGPDALEELRKHLLLCYTGRVRRDVGLIDRQIAMFEAGREETLLGMKQLQEMAYVMRDAVESGDMTRLGALLGEAFGAKRRMNPHIAEGTPIEAMLAAASAAGSTGGKICGAGGGGYLLIAAPPEARAAVRAALESMGGQFAPFEVDPQGVRARRGERRWSPTRP